jgi:autotransporter-associated beta strand protein
MNLTPESRRGGGSVRQVLMTTPTIPTLVTLRSFLVLLAGLAALAAGAHPAAAATRTWSGAGGNNQWMTAANWQGGVAPVAGDDLVFPVGGAQPTNVNNFPAGTTFGSITFVAAYTVGGNALAMTGTLAVTSAASPTITLGMPVTIASASDLTVNVMSAGATLELGGTLSGAAGLTKIGSGTLRMIGTTSNTYTGLTSVNEGTLVLGRMQPAISIPAGLTVGNANGGLNADVVRLESPEQIAGPLAVTVSGWLDLAGSNQTMTTTLTMQGGRITTGAGVLTLNANITVPAGVSSATIEGQLSLGGATRTFEILNTTFPGLDIKAIVVDGGGAAGLIKTGVGRVRLSGANTYTGFTTIQNGSIMAAHPQALGSSGAGTGIASLGTLRVESDIPAEPIVAQNTTSAQSIFCDTPGTFSIGGPITLVIGQVDMAAGYGCHLVFNGPMSGQGGLLLTTFSSPTSLTLDAVNTFTGVTEVGGNVRLGVNDALSASSIVLVNTGVLDFQNHSQTMKFLTGGGEVLLGSATLTIDAPQNALAFHEVISGSGGVIKKGVGTWYLSGANTYTGPTLVQGGFLSVPGSIVSSVTLDGGTLQGNGTVGPIGGTSGTLEPTYLGSPTKLTSGPLTLTPGITFHAILDGPGAGTQYSQLVVNGTIDLGGATLNADVNSNFLTANVGELILIDNDGVDPVVGTFQGLPQDSIIQSGGKAFRLSYVAGTGNDVALLPTESTYYLSEGATGSFFDTEILIANPNADAVPISIDFLKEDGTTISQTSTLAASSRITIRADDIAGLEAAAFSTVVKSLTGLPIVVERTMRWDASGYGAHTDKATGGAAYTWYFAEGSQGFFWTYLLLTNPNASANEATVTFLRENLPPLERKYPLGPKSRATIDLGQDADLMHTSFGIEVRFDNPGTAERAMYFGESPLWKGGHESAGETVTSSNWFLAEGATGTFFETFILIANTHTADIEATLTFFPATGVPVEKKKMVPARGRITVNVETEDPSLTDVAVATQVTSLVPRLIVERAQYWPLTPDLWHESHNSFGVTAPGTRWGLAEGRAGGPENYQTYLLLANPGTTDAEATVLFLRESGAPLSKTIAVPAQTRVNLSVGADVPELANERFGAVITSDQLVVVERAMFWDANGQFWAAGTNATATRLP